MLQIGSKVHCILYGGKDGIVYNINGAQRPDTVKNLGGIMTAGGSADLDIVWENGTLSKRTPESIVVGGVQWRILEGIATAQEIIAALEYTEKETAREAAEATAAATQRNLDREALKLQYDYLKQDPASGGKGVAVNVRIELKRAWPKIKFSVTSDYSSVDVRWIDGPTEKQVDDVIQKYKAGSFNGMEDIYEYKSNAFTDLFGDARYINGHRETSPEQFNRAFAMLKAHYSGNIDKDFTCTVEDWKSGKLQNVSMNTDGESYRDNVSQYMNRVTNMLPAPGYENKHHITNTGGKFQVHYYDYRYGSWDDREEVTLADCVQTIKDAFWDHI